MRQETAYLWIGIAASVLCLSSVLYNPAGEYEERIPKAVAVVIVPFYDPAQSGYTAFIPYEEFMEYELDTLFVAPGAGGISHRVLFWGNDSKGMTHVSRVKYGRNPFRTIDSLTSRRLEWRNETVLIVHFEKNWYMVFISCVFVAVLFFVGVVNVSRQK